MKWHPLKGFEGLYEITRTGLIRTVRRYYKSGEYYHKQLLPQKLMSFSRDKNGYFRIALRKNGKRHYCRRSRLVAINFIDNPKNKPCINHKNGIKHDDRIINLEWCTVQENNIHSIKILGNMPYKIPPMKGSDNPAARPVYKLSTSGKVLKKYGYAREAVKDGFNPGNICSVARGNRLTHGGFKWSYAV